MKAKFYIGSLIAAMMISVSAFGQIKSASSVMNNMVNILKNNSIQTNFGLVVKDANSSKPSVMGGTFLMKGNQFTFSTKEMQVYFDGKTQWAFMPDINEVSITSPTEKELAETNPLALLQAYSTKSTAQFIKNNAVKDAYTIELTPRDKTSDIKKIQVVVNKKSYFPQTIQLADKKGMISTLALTKFQKGVKTDEKTFTFNSSVYKDIEINDLR